MNKHDIISVVTTVGEFVGKFVEQDDVSVTVSDPRMIVHNQSGMGFSAGVSMAGEESPTKIEFFKTNVVFVGATNEDVQKAYRQFTSGIIV